MWIFHKHNRTLMVIWQKPRIVISLVFPLYGLKSGELKKNKDDNIHKSQANESDGQTNILKKNQCILDLLSIP